MTGELPFPRYRRKGKCLQCGWCCLRENPLCPHLKFRDDGSTVCLIHRKASRPSYCRNYPGNPPILHEGCGYYFLDRWDDNKIIKAGETI